MKVKSLILALLFTIAALSLPAHSTINEGGIKSISFSRSSEKFAATGGGVGPVDPGGGGSNGGVWGKLQETYMGIYFSHLNTNLGNNQKGSCGYVAAGMLLSYYDTLIDDDIIPEQYEVKTVLDNTDLTLNVQSPGISYDVYGKGLSDELYYAQLEYDQGRSFHAKLIVMAEENYNYYKPNTDDPFGLTIQQCRDVIKRYLGVERKLMGLPEYREHMEYWFDYCGEGSHDEIRRGVINDIKQGYPVLVGLSGKDSNGKDVYHASVAYAYDEENDEIYFHSGYSSLDVDNVNASYITLNENIRSGKESVQYDKFVASLGLRINAEHNHSNNYIIKDTDSHSYYCVCNDITTESHTYLLSDKEYTDTTHKEYCTICGATKNVMHSYTAKCINVSSFGHWKYCICGKYKIEPHKFVSSGSSTQYKYCECGAVSCVGEHSYTYRYENSSSTMHKMYCICGQYKEGNHLWIGISSTHVQCKTCKAIRTKTPGDLVPLPGVLSRLGNVAKMFEGISENSEHTDCCTVECFGAA